MALAICFLTILASHLLPSRAKGGVHDLGGIPILTAWAFFSKRYDFLWKHFNSGKRYFQFYVQRQRVVALSGEDARKIFYNEQGLVFGEGFRLLASGSLQSGDNNVKSEGGAVTHADFLKRLVSLMRKDRISDVLPALLDDVDRRMKDWGNEGTINPFNDIYELIFQMLVRIVTCQELAEDKADIKHLAQHYWDVEKSITPMNFVLPWFPSQAKKTRERATRELFTLIYKYVDLRRKASVPSNDPIDTLIVRGDTNETIVTVVMIMFFAAVINTGVNSCWILLNLGANPEWKSKVTQELKDLVANHTNTLSKEPLHKRLAAIPLNAWEEELPLCDLAIRESLRITMTNSVYRRNLGRDIHLGDAVIRRGDFLIYSLADVHMDANIYTNPRKFDPGRFMKGKEEDQKEAHTFLGWGAGRHPCLGMSTAKLEMKLLLTMFLVGYEYELVDANGDLLKELPLQDRNDACQARPLGDDCYMKFKRVIE